MTYDVPEDRYWRPKQNCVTNVTALMYNIRYSFSDYFSAKRRF